MVRALASIAAVVLLLLLTGCGGSDRTATDGLSQPIAQPTRNIVLYPDATTVDGRAITIRGTIQAQGMTSYQYGTHALVDGAGRTLYALRRPPIARRPHR